MFPLYYNNGMIFVYNVEDWTLLRKIHRVIGEIVGNTSNVPSLPVQLTPEETLFLLNKDLVEIREVVNFSSEQEKDSLKKYESELLEQQKIEYKKSRRIQLENMLDLIVEQKKKLNDTRSPEEIFNEELDKSTLVTDENMIWPILLHSEFLKSDYRLLKSEDILKLTSSLKFRVYSDLHDRGYYITRGEKFGGDFLVYFGDPICFHAIFIIKCIETEQCIMPSEIVAFGRLGTSVRKRAVLASLVDDEICYITINWIDA